jgi:hypothetical protein
MVCMLQFFRKLVLMEAFVHKYKTSPYSHKRVVSNNSLFSIIYHVSIEKITIKLIHNVGNSNLSSVCLTSEKSNRISLNVHTENLRDHFHFGPHGSVVTRTLTKAQSALHEISENNP